MADEEKKHHHHLFHRHKDGEEEASTGEVDYEKKEKHHKHLEQLGGLGAIAAGAYAIVSARRFLLILLILFTRTCMLIYGVYVCACWIDRAAREAQGEEGPRERARAQGEGGGGGGGGPGLGRVRVPRASPEEGRQEAGPELS